jgi:1-pyrroline-5-carboxylate dehydrogenase
MSQPKITYVSLSADESIHPKYEAALKTFEQKLGGHYPMYIGGNEVRTKKEFVHKSPIDTSIAVCWFPSGEGAHAKEAIASAKAAFPAWSGMEWKERVRLLKRSAELIDERKFEIAAAITYEVGKNRMEALAEAWEAVDSINYCAGLMESNSGYVERMGPGGPGEVTDVHAKPLGVWPVISPFNFPFMLGSGMAIGALITGNTIVLKPTSSAPLTGLMLYKVFADAGLPTGAVNFVTGPGGNFEDEFASNRDVAGIAFTGSRDVGMRLYRRFLEGQPYPKPIVLEMGSKNPTIVSAKADMAKAVEGTVRAAFGYGGQKCSATSRVYVQKQVKDKFLSALHERMATLVVGDPRRREVFMGPVINEAAVKKYEAAVTDVKKAHGSFLEGGDVLKNGPLGRGYYVSAAVVTGLPPDHRLFREELFLPFVVVDVFDELSQGIERANDTDYGLTAGIFSEDPVEVRQFMDGIQFGVAYANRKGGSTTGAWPGAQSFVGWNASGATGRGVGGSHYLLNFMRDQSQTVVS